MGPNTLVKPTCVAEPNTWQALSDMCLVERSRFGLNDLLGRKVSEISPIGRVSAFEPVSEAAFPVRKPKCLGARRRACLRGRTPQPCFRPRARTRGCRGASREQGNDAGRRLATYQARRNRSLARRGTPRCLAKGQQKALSGLTPKLSRTA